VKVALVTGANTGIGLAIAERLLADGYALGFATVDTTHEEPLERLRGAYGKERLHWAWGDLADASIPGRLVEETVGALGRIDVLVNNAGIVTAKPALDITATEFDLTFAVDVRASFLLAQAAARQMPDGGSIVNITSVHEQIPRPGLSVYAAAKAALGMLGRSLAVELADRGIRVNSVAPGVIATARNEGDAGTLNSEVPLGRPGTPVEVAGLVSWLCSDEAAYVTGASYIIDGGMTQQVVKIPAG
jgi:NAD(P)-dependent dehydrogenase (short-subunit alcohol dehydrogenase family)